MVCELFHVGARKDHLTMVTQKVQARREPDLSSKNVDPVSSLPARSMHTILSGPFYAKDVTTSNQGSVHLKPTRKLECVSSNRLRLYRCMRRPRIVDACELLTDASRCDRL